MTNPFPHHPQLLPEGIIEAASVAPYETPPGYEQLRVTEGMSLAEMSHDWRFFTLAIVDLFLPEVPNFPVAYGLEFGRMPQVKYFDVSGNFYPFRGDLPEPFRRRILAIHVSMAKKYLEWLSTCAITDPSTGALYRIRFQDFDISDPLSCKDEHILVRGFCLDTTKGCYYWQRYVMPGGMLAAVKRFREQPFEDTVRFAQALQADPNPYQQVRNQLAEKEPHEGTDQLPQCDRGDT